MTDYLTLIQRAVDELTKNTAETRRSLYERARTALVVQLRAIEPPYSGAEITKERLALEEAISKVEAAAARRALNAPRAEQRIAAAIPRALTAERAAAAGSAATLLRQRPIPAAELPALERAVPLRQQPQRQELPRQELPRQEFERQDLARPDLQIQAPPAADAAVKQTARSRILDARTTALRPDGRNGLRDDNAMEIAGAPLQGASAERGPAGPGPRRRAPRIEEPPAADTAGEPDERPGEEDYALHGPLDGPLDGRSAAARTRGLRSPPAQTEAADEEEEAYEESPPRSYRSLVPVFGVVIAVAALATAGWLFRVNIANTYHSITHGSTAGQTTPATSAPPSKFAGRVPQEGIAGQTQVPPQGVQRSVLLEQDPGDPQGKRFDGTVTWRTETVSPGPGLAPELEVHADIAIPQRHMTVTLSLRRNTDKALPASHTIQMMFNLPPDFPGQGVSSMPGVFAKDSEQATGTPLAGISVKVTDNYFLLGLSADPTQEQHNVQLLKDQKWFDIAMVYKNNTKAILAVERGAPGDKAFADAFKAWGE